MSGTWALTSMSCGSTDITAALEGAGDFFGGDLYQWANGGCHGVMVNTGPNCQETAEYDASLSGQTETDNNTGITCATPTAAIRSQRRGLRGRAIAPGRLPRPR